MTIEPISSVMTVQAQGTVAPRPQPSVQTEKPESSATSSAPAAEYVDKTTSVVENSQEKGQTDNGEQGKDQQQVYHEKIRKAVETLNKQLANSEAVFGIHEDTNRVTIKIVDKSTKEVIKELPPEKTLDMIAKVWEMAGILIDERR